LIDVDSNDGKIQRLTSTAIAQLGDTASQNLETKIVELEDNTFEVPCDMYRLVKVTPENSDVALTTMYKNGRVYVTHKRTGKVKIVYYQTLFDKDEDGNNIPAFYDISFNQVFGIVVKKIITDMYASGLLDQNRYQTIMVQINLLIADQSSSIKEMTDTDIKDLMFVQRGGRFNLLD
jgi:hypothetical protein